ncbi:DUF1194 domain-containing protein [Rhodobacteraceae bacterium KN286]|uniref:DUF1194 domain-containing protein n=1 Tax=Oceanomicrobium pacificus TaxID=2692916 RepID=A0A6B0TUA3_9RHOB|nr:DUF1194 domain-containing protein [Oceanomicrobium pacificus]
MATTIALAAAALPASACDVALALTVDVSGSISPEEYRLQMDGLADALEQSTIADALVATQAALSLVQWTGASRQELSIDWRRMKSLRDVAEMARIVRATPRAWEHFSTAIGNALLFTAVTFEAVPDCTRRVIDVSGDGSSNEGTPPAAVRAQMAAMGITVNGLAIADIEANLTPYYHNHVITGDGAFVITARDYADYPRAIERKLLAEIGRPTS